LLDELLPQAAKTKTSATMQSKSLFI